MIFDGYDITSITFSLNLDTYISLYEMNIFRLSCFSTY